MYNLDWEAPFLTDPPILTPPHFKTHISDNPQLYIVKTIESMMLYQKCLELQMY